MSLLPPILKAEQDERDQRMTAYLLHPRQSALSSSRDQHLVRDFPLPELPASMALVKVLRAGICSTDLEMLEGYKSEFADGLNRNLVIGHEFVGIVEAINCVEQPASISVGSRVVGEINLPCMGNSDIECS